MKNLICEKCNTNFDDFVENNNKLYCKCKPEGTYYILSSGIYINYNNSFLTRIQICYLDLEFNIDKEKFSLSKYRKFMFEDYHYLSLDKDFTSNIKEKLEFCLKYSESLIFL